MEHGNQNCLLPAYYYRAFNIYDFPNVLWHFENITSTNWGHRTPNAANTNLNEGNRTRKKLWVKKNYVLRFIIRPTESHYTHALAAFNIINFSLYVFFRRMLFTFRHLYSFVYFNVFECLSMFSVQKRSLALSVESKWLLWPHELRCHRLFNFIKLIVSLAIYSQGACILDMCLWHRKPCSDMHI